MVLTEVSLGADVYILGVVWRCWLHLVEINPRGWAMYPGHSIIHIVRGLYDFAICEVV
jgi:hypothetical protein